MTLQISITHPDRGPVLTATVDPTTRRTLDLTLAPGHLPTLFIALNALIGEIEAHLSLGTIAQPIDAKLLPQA